LSDTNSINLGTTTAFRRSLDALKNNKDYWIGALSDYFDLFVHSFEKFRIIEHEGEYDDKVINNLEQFIPYRNELVAIFHAIARYRNVHDAHKTIHYLFERLIPYMDRPEGMKTFTRWDFDNFRFIVHELFLYVIAIFLKNECFYACAYLLSQQFYVTNDDYDKGLKSFSYLRQSMEILNYRNERLAKNTGMKRWSIRADLLKERCGSSGILFQDLMQADFVLYLRDAVDSLRYDQMRQSYWPESLLYLPRFGHPFELFARAESLQYFNEMKIIFNISSKDDFQPFIQAVQKGSIYLPKWNYETINPIEFMGFDKIGTKP
jgi:hypothetical protein